MTEKDAKTMLYLTRLIEELSNLNTPIVFKGAMVVWSTGAWKIMNTARSTQDVDGDWVSGKPTMEQLEHIMNIAASRIEPGMYVVVVKDYAEDRAAKFTFYGSDNKPVCKMDLRVQPNPFYVTYVTVNGIKFNGSSPARMLVDKIEVLSSDKAYTRVKDVFDVFLLSALTGYTLNGMNEIRDALGKKFGDFRVFLKRTEKMKGVWDRQFLNVDNKPIFWTVYNRARHFCEPWMQNIQVNLVWDGNNWVMP